MAKMNLSDFQSALKNNKEFRESIETSSDICDIENGIMIINEQNINKYLEQYMCKDEEDLSDTLFYKFGIYLTVKHNVI